MLSDDNQREPEPGLIGPAIAAFEAAADGEDVLVSLLKGLNYVVMIADGPESLQASRNDADKLVDAITAAGPVNQDRIGSMIGKDNFLLGMTGAFGLAALFGRSGPEVRATTTGPLLHDCFDHALLLLAELQTLLCRHRIEQRGNLLHDIMFDRRIINISKH